MGTPLNLSRFTKAPPKSSSDLRTYAAAIIRGLSGFSPGGLIGAGVGAVGEGLAQTIEPREDYNLPQIATQASLGAIPFGKAAGIAKNMLKGGALSSVGSLATQQAEEGLHVPTVEEIGSSAIAGGIGSLAGAIKLPERFIGRGKTASAKANTELITKSSKEPVKIELSAPVAKTGKVEPNQPNIKLDLRTRPKNPVIMSGDREAGRKIMEQILAESAASKPSVTPIIPAKTPEVNLKGESVISWLNVPKAVAASMDLSAPLRQGIFLIGRKQWRNALGPMIRSLSEKNYNEINAVMHAHPKYKGALESGLMITDFDKLGSREEQFASRIAEKIPGIKASERAYSTFLNKLRFDLYNDLVDKAASLKIPIPKENIASYINAATGRGKMALTVSGEASKTLEAAAPFLNTTFFSPRFIASRVQLLNPITYVKLDPFTRKEYLRDLVTLSGVASSVLTLAKLGGAEVTEDPTSTDFGKIKSGNTRVDMLGGFGQYIRFASQIVKGLATEETGPDPKRFIESKLSPTARMALDMISGKDYFGREISIPKSALQNFAPMITRDIYELWKEDPNLVPLAGLSFFGLPAQNYGETTSRTGTPSGIPRIVLPNLP